MEQLRALSVRQPWAHAIVHFGKDIENRTRRFGHRGWTLIHASGGMAADEWERAEDFLIDRGLPANDLPDRKHVQLGGVVGVARIVDSVGPEHPRAGSKWWMGPYGLVIDEAHALPFTPCKGTVAPLFWLPPADVLEALAPALRQLGVPVA